MSEAVETRADRFLGGRVTLIQPLRGHHRAGLEAALLAASVRQDCAGRVIDLGAGVGAAGMGVAVRCPRAEVVLVERDPALVGLAAAALRLPDNAVFAERVRLAELDIEAPADARLEAGLEAGSAAVAIANPPFYRVGRVRVSPHDRRAAAHVREGGLDVWFRFAAWALAASGRLIVIAPSADLPEIIELCRGRFGDVCVLPLHPRPQRAAVRVLVAAAKGSRSGLRVLPGVTLHEGPGPRFAAEVDGLLRGETGLSELAPEWPA